MGAIADANRTYKNVTLTYKPGQAGVQVPGAPETVLFQFKSSHSNCGHDVLGVETITNMEIIDGGKDFKANGEILQVRTPISNGK